MRVKRIVKANSNRNKLVAKRVSSGCGCGKKRTKIK